MQGAPDRATASVTFGDRVHDREAEPDPTRHAAPRRVRPAEAVEDPVERFVRDPASLVLDLDPDLSRGIAICAELDHVVLVRVLDRVLQQRVQCAPQPLTVDHQRDPLERPKPPGPVGCLGPADEDILQERL